MVDIDTPYFVIDTKVLDCSQVIRELTAYDSLPQDYVRYATTAFEAYPNESHVAVGKTCWELSKTLVAFLEILGLTDVRATLFVSRPGKVTFWHRDGQNIKCAINIPWFNTAHTFTHWYAGEDLHGTPLPNPDSTERCITGTGAHVQPSYKSELLTAQLINVDLYHRVDSTAAVGIRGIISLRFNNNNTFDDTLHRIRKTLV